MVQPTTWLLLALLAGSPAAAQPHPPVRQRQDRSALLSATLAEPLLELYMAAGSRTTVAFDRGLDRDSLVVDRTRFKWVDIGDNTLSLRLAEDVVPGERLIVKLRFKDQALPAQVLLAIVTHPSLVDGNVDVSFEHLKARCEPASPVGHALAEWLDRGMRFVHLVSAVAPGDTSGLRETELAGYTSQSSALLAVRLRNLPGQPPWAVGQVRITSAAGVPATVLSVWMKQPYLAPNEEGLVVVEMETAPWSRDQDINVELVDASGQRRLRFKLKAI